VDVSAHIHARATRPCEYPSTSDGTAKANTWPLRIAPFAAQSVAAEGVHLHGGCSLLAAGRRAWINDQFGLWLPADDVAVMFFGEFVTPGDFIRAFPHLAMLPDEAFHFEEKMNGRLDQSSESGGRRR
jgi:hypothetical protein